MEEEIEGGGERGIRWEKWEKKEEGEGKWRR